MRSLILVLSIFLILFISNFAHARTGRGARDLASFSKPIGKYDPLPQRGFELGVSLSGFVILDKDAPVVPIPGKVDLTLGYRFNPYFSLSADLWTFWFLAYGAEIKPKINFVNGNISPFIAGTVGLVGIIPIFDWDDDDGDNAGRPPLLTYSAGPGIDFRVGRRMLVTTDIRYRGVYSPDNWDDSSNYGHALETGVGMIFKF